MRVGSLINYLRRVGRWGSAHASFWGTIGLLMLVLAFWGSFVINPDEPVKGTPQAVGVVDYAAAAEKSGAIVSLRGMWRFLWLEPREVNLVEPLAQIEGQASLWRMVPAPWSRYTYRGEKLPAEGMAVYQLTVKGLAPENAYALYLGNITSAYRLFIDGQEVGGCGVVGTSTTVESLENRPMLFDIAAGKEKIHIALLVSNFNYSRGGIREAPIFGPEERLRAMLLHRKAMDFLVAGAIGAFAFLFFVIFLVQGGKNKETAFFALMCLIVAVRSMSTGEAAALDIFPELAFTWRILFNYIFSFNVFPLLYLFLSQVFPGEIKRKHWPIFIPLMIVLNVVLLMTPARVYTVLINAYFMVTILYAGYFIFFLALAVWRRRELSAAYFIAVVLFASSIYIDYMATRGLLGIAGSNNNTYALPVLLAVMALSQSISIRLTAQRLKSANLALLEAKQVEEELHRQEMAFLRAQIKPHFLFNALNSIAALIHRGDKSALPLLDSLSAYLRFSFDFSADTELITLRSELELLDAYLSLEKARFGEKIEYCLDIEAGVETMLPSLTIQPLVENAIRHGLMSQRGQGRVELSIWRENDRTIIRVADDGSGFIQGADGFPLGDRAKAGVGLRNIDARLRRHFGAGLQLQSTLGQGTVVVFSIPSSL